MSNLPSYEQVAALPVTLRQVVPPEFIDQNGHMNIQHYLVLGATGVASLYRELGMSDDYIGRRGLSTFTAEHHLRYVGEIREGADVSVRVLVVDRGGKAFHVLSLIVDETQERLACVMETALVHMDMSTRRPSPIPDDIAALIDAVAERDRPDWDLPLSGSIGVRR
ncbi:thioesterase family protein [Aeromicrobium alkaliterrae]|uniref:Thioesterase n=1 Tax=Aeromicrobium alkaliterrae TaxID=302168 RepID=A0ABN2JXX1_9ACTN